VICGSIVYGTTLVIRSLLWSLFLHVLFLCLLCLLQRKLLFCTMMAVNTRFKIMKGLC